MLFSILQLFIYMEGVEECYTFKGQSLEKGLSCISGLYTVFFFHKDAEPAELSTGDRACGSQLKGQTVAEPGLSCVLYYHPCFIIINIHH